MRKLEDVGFTGDPHPGQKLAFSSISAPHFGHIIISISSIISHSVPFRFSDRMKWIVKDESLINKRIEKSKEQRSILLIDLAVLQIVFDINVNSTSSFGKQTKFFYLPSHLLVSRISNRLERADSNFEIGRSFLSI